MGFTIANKKITISISVTFVLFFLTVTLVQSADSRWTSELLTVWDESNNAFNVTDIRDSSNLPPDFSGGTATKFSVKIDVTASNKVDPGDGIQCSHCEAYDCADMVIIGTLDNPVIGLYYLNSTDPALLARIEGDGVDIEWLNCSKVGDIPVNEQLIANIYVDFNYSAAVDETDPYWNWAYDNITGSTILSGNSFVAGTEWADAGDGLDVAWFRTNATGSWLNTTYQEMGSAATYIFNTTLTTNGNDYGGDTICWTQIANDTAAANNWNDTMLETENCIDVLYNFVPSISINDSTINTGDAAIVTATCGNPGEDILLETYITILDNQTGSDIVTPVTKGSNKIYANDSTYYLGTWSSASVIRDFKIMAVNKGSYNITIRCNSSEVTESVSTKLEIADTDAPTVTNARYNDLDSLIEVFSEIKVNATVIEVGGGTISTVLIQMTKPDGSIQNYTTSSSGSEYFNTSINLTVIGNYSFLFYANDTANNINFTVNASKEGGGATTSLTSRDTTDPTGDLGSWDDTDTTTGSTVCINVTGVADNYAIDTVNVTIMYPNETVVAVYLDDDTSSCSGSAGDGDWGIDVNVGSTVGTLWANVSAVNDTSGNVFTSIPTPGEEPKVTVVTGAVDTSFRITMPGSNVKHINSTDPMLPNATLSMNFTMSSTGTAGTQANVAPCVGATSDCQSDGTAFFVFENVGGVTINITMQLNVTMPSNIALVCDKDNSPAGATAITTENYNVSNDLETSSAISIWCWASFTNTRTTDITERKLIHNATESA
ncbi:MAG: hypothetical protein ABIF08_02500 [Nanoarchaeota archaeon]